MLRVCGLGNTILKVQEEENSVAVNNSKFVVRMVQMGVLALSVLFVGSIAAQSRDEQIAERLKPIGDVCLAGESCARGGASAGAQAASGAAAEFSAEQAYQQNCQVCHASGMAGAPKFGDAAAWATRMEKGMDAVVANAINGLNAMPPRGMCMTCSDDNIAALVEYISGHAQ